MNLHISVSTYCPRASVERKVTCYQSIFDGYYCKGCEDTDGSDTCKKCINDVEQKLTPDDFS